MMKPMPPVAGAWRRLQCALVLVLLLSPALADDFSVTSGLSAHWYNPERDGEGLVLEVLDEETALLYWFTYDEEGNQRWLLDVGQIDGSEIVFPELTVTRGGRFGPDFDPNQVDLEVVGEASLSFTDCDQGEFTYSAFGHSETIPMERLSQTMAAGCQVPHGIPGEPIRDYAGQSGSWYDPAHNGEGYTLHWLSRDEALLIWFSYDREGNQVWMTGTGSYEDGIIEFPMLQSTQGGRFGGFDPEDVDFINWGSLELELDCQGGSAQYDSLLQEYGAGSLELERLTYLVKPTCPWIRPSLTDLYDFDIAPVPLAFDGAPPSLRARDIADDGTVVAWAPNGTIWRWRRGENDLTELSSDTFMRDPLVRGDGTRIVASARPPTVSDGEVYGPRYWDSQAGWEQLSGLVLERSRALILSTSGDIIAGVGRNWDESGDKPWVWTPESGQIILPTTPETSLSAPLGVSDDATRVVGSVLKFSPMRMQAIRWVGNSEPEFLYDHLGHRLGGTSACDSNCNVVVGGGQGEEAAEHPYRTQAWYWKSTGEMDYFGSLSDALPDAPGAPYAPSGISGDGTIVAGRYLLETTRGTVGSMGFLWTQVTGLTSMNDVLEELDLGNESWLEMTVWISTRGDLLLLDGRSQEPSDPEPRRRAYLLRMHPSESMQTQGDP